MNDFPYYVPMILPVLAVSSFFLKILAIPKSDILGFISASNKMLLTFRSLWITVYIENSWRYRRPCVIPSMTRTRFSQSNDKLLNESAGNRING